MGALTEALAQHVGSALRTGIKATAITADSSGHYRIDCEDPISGKQALQVFARSVIIATPAAAAAEMMSALDPSLGPLFASIESAPVVTASLAFSPADFDSGPPVGYGLVRPRCEGSRLLGCLFPSSAFEGTAPPGVIHLRVLAGGRRDPDAYGLSNDELLDLTREELRPILGLRPDARPSVFHTARHRLAFPQYEIGHLSRVHEIERTLLRFPQVHLAGNSYYGLSVSKVVENAEQLSARILARRAAA
jgi:oxygen-dependent protoporphyrinogen oxidase